MKNALIFGASMLAVAAAAIVPASAADMYRADVGGYKDAPIYSANIWSGFYAGAHLGGAWGTSDVKGTPSFSSDANGVIAGGQLGYNWERGNLVLGLELDLGSMDVSHSAAVPGTALRSSLDSGFYGDITGRLGYSFGTALLYAKGGFAALDAEGKVTAANGIVTPTNSFTGWTLGGGLEYSLSSAWSVKAEYQHFDFGSEQSNLNIGGRDFKFDHDLTVDTVKAGVNYHVGHGYEPLK